MCFRFYRVLTRSQPLAVSGRFRHGMLVTTEQLARLGHYITSRRVALGYKTRVDLATALGITDRTLSDIEHGVRKANAGTYALIENKMSWRPGSISATIDGGEPVPLDESDEPAIRNLSTDELLDRQAELQAELQRRLRGRGPQVNPDAPPV